MLVYRIGKNTIMYTCPHCSKQLWPDSHFCDKCGNKVSWPTQEESNNIQEVFDTQLLLKWVLLSVVITLVVSMFFGVAGLPIFIGGLFLPLFWFKKKKKQ